MNKLNWQFYTYTNIRFPRFYDFEYTALEFTDFLDTYTLFLLGYHEFPSPGELSKLMIAPTQSLIVQNGMAELPLSWCGKDGVLLKIGRTIYQCQALPHRQTTCRLISSALYEGDMVYQVADNDGKHFTFRHNWRHIGLAGMTRERSAALFAERASKEPIILYYDNHLIEPVWRAMVGVKENPPIIPAITPQYPTTISA